MRIGINLFLALMLAVVGGVIYQPIIEMPVGIYYDAEISHTATDYSYKPGQSGTEYRFFVKNEERGFSEVNTFASFGISTLFYFSFIALLGLVRWAIRRNKPLKEIPKNKYDDKTYERLMKFRENARKRKPLGTVVMIFFVGLFFYSGRNNLFGLGIGGNSDQVKEVAEANFKPTHLIYADNGEGDGNIWMIREDKSGEGAVYIEGESSASFDSIIYSVRLLNQKKEKRIKIEDFVVSDEMSSFDPFYGDDKIWLTARPNMMRVYDKKSKKVVYETADDFGQNFPELQSGIFKHYRHDYMGTDVLRIETLDGGVYYYHFDSDTLVESLSDLKSTESFQKFELQRDNGERYNLAVVDMDQEIPFTENVTLFEAFSSNDMQFERFFIKSTVIEDKFFITASVLAQSWDKCFILHKKDVTENSMQMISALDSTATILWSVNSNKFPKKSKDQYMPGLKSAQAQIDGDVLVVNFIQDWEACGMMGIDINKGKVLWKYNYSDLGRID